MYPGFTEFIDLLLDSSLGMIDQHIFLFVSLVIKKTKIKQYNIKQSLLSATKIPFGDKVQLSDFIASFFPPSTTF